MATKHTSHRQFDTRLRRLFWRSRLRALGHGLLRFSGVVGAMVLLAVWIPAGGTSPGRFNAWGLSLSLAAGVLILGWQLVVRPWLNMSSPRQLARRLDRMGGFANLIVAAEEMGRCPERWRAETPVAVELTRRLVARANAVLIPVSVGDVVPGQYVRSSAVGLALVVLSGVWLWASAPVEMAQSWRHLVAPGLGAPALPTGGLYAERGPNVVVVGQDVILSSVDFAGGDDGAVAEVRVGTGTWQKWPSRQIPVLGTAAGLPVPYRRWQVTAPAVREDFAWRFRRGRMVTAVRQVTVKHYPLLAALQATIVPPAYTLLPPRELAPLPTWIEAPQGSRLEVSGRASHLLTAASLLVAGGDTLGLAVDSVQVAGVLEVTDDLAFVVDLTDDFGLHNASPLRYEVEAVADQLPTVSLERPDDDGILPLSGEVNLAVVAADDYGLAQLELLVRDGRRWLGGAFWRLAQCEDGWQDIETAVGTIQVRAQRLDNGATGVRGRWRLELRTSDLDLVAGDGLEMLVEAVDNKRPLPAGRSRSAALRLVLPSTADVLAGQAKANEGAQSELAEMRAKSVALNADLNRLTRELMKDPEPDWTRQQEMDAAISRQQKLQNELSRVAAELKAELAKLAGSQLASDEQLAKAEEMSALLNPEPSEQRPEVRDPLSAEGGRDRPSDAAQAMAKVAENQKDMARRLDAALAMLKQMAQEQELEGLTALLEQMIRKQQELADLSREMAAQQKESAESAESSEPSDASDPSAKTGSDPADEADAAAPHDETGASPEATDLAKRQEALTKDLAELEKQLAEALANLQQENAEEGSDASQELEDALSDAADKLAEQRQKDNMGQAEEELAQMDPGQAAKMQEQAVRDLGSLYSVLLKSQQSMQQAMKMEQVTSLRALAANLLALSARQEEVAALIPAELRDVRVRALMRSQHRLQKATIGVRAHLETLMNEAPNRILKLLQQVDELVEVMGEAVHALEASRAREARRYAQDSLAGANRMVIGLLTEAQMQGSGSGGGSSGKPSSGQSLSEQLQQMAQEQAKLNGVTAELRQMLADRGISQQARSKMQRLGEDQARMAARMGEIAAAEREQPDGERLLGDLAELGRDMESIGGDLASGQMTEETLVRQNRILGRMLDARNSVRRRDYTNRRESETATGLYADQRGRTADDGEGEAHPFQVRYLPLEQAPMEYRDLVRRYYAALDSLARAAEAAVTP